MAVVDTNTLEVLARIAVGQRPWNMSINRDGSKLYVAAGRSNAVTVIDAVHYTLIKSIPVGLLPWGTAAN